MRMKEVYYTMLTISVLFIITFLVSMVFILPIVKSRLPAGEATNLIMTSNYIFQSLLLLYALCTLAVALNMQQNWAKILMYITATVYIIICTSYILSALFMATHLIWPVLLTGIPLMLFIAWNTYLIIFFKNAKIKT